MSMISRESLGGGAVCPNVFLINQSLEEIFKQHRVSERAIETLYLYLGEGDSEIGALKLYEYQEKGLIRLERVGFDKHGQDKFYIMIRESLNAGGWNQFHIGISRRGALRGVLRPISMDRIDSIDLGNARELREKLGRKYQGPISRLMNDENGVKVTELGGENLYRLSNRARLTKQERLIIYKSLFQGILELHRHGYVHTDLKLENVVVVRDREKNITGVKIIDLDRLRKIDECHKTRMGSRYFPYSPERILGKDDGLANPKDDIWAAMCLICDFESRVDEEDCLLGPAVISKYKQYQENLKSKDVACEEIYQNKSLFSGTRPNNLFQNLIFHMGTIDPVQRPSAEKIIPFLTVMG